MKPSSEKDFTKRGIFPSHAARNGLVRSSTKKRSQLNPNNTKPGAGSGSSYNYDDDFVEATPLNDKNTRKDEGDDEANKTPPVEASVSPEIQMMSSSTPATGHRHHHIHTAVSGISDNRKCRARGLLSATNKLADAEAETALPLPSHASMHWLNNHSPTSLFATTNSSPDTSTCKSNSSANVIRTPTSADSQLDSVAESLRAAGIDFSFEFDAVAVSVSSSSSVDLTHFRPHQLLRDSCCSETDDADRSDCCRFSSDNDDDDEDPNIVFDDIVPTLEPEAQRDDYASGSSAESISIDGGDPLASKDSDWDFDRQL